MSIRQHKRFTITLHAQVTIGDKSYDGVISNVSEEGVSSTVTTFIKTDAGFAPSKDISLSFQLPSGDMVKLNCEIRWYLRPKEKERNIMIGLYIKDPPQLYTDWINKFK